MSLAVGIDFGTSGCRATAINEAQEIVAQFATPSAAPDTPRPGWSEQDAEVWWNILQATLTGLLATINAADIDAIAIDGTSSTLVVCDQQGIPLGPALMYNDIRSISESELIRQQLPPNSAVHGPSSSLAKLLYLQARHSNARYALHQSDWLMGRLSGHYGNSDENNCLKLGYLPNTGAWLEGLKSLKIITRLLPRVYPPATSISLIDKAVARQLGLRENTQIVTGTTDSTAAFLATGAQRVGEAVTSLGSTLVTKIISAQPIYSSQQGVYSHKMYDRWITGGASNSGGAVLLTYFSVSEMVELTPLLEPDTETGLDYYPLPSRGERFPVADPHLKPRLPTAMPADRPARAFIFQGLLEGISKIEARAYRLLSELGAPYPEKILSVGGGSVNPAWNQIRERYLGIPVVRARHHEASFGAALLAQAGTDQSLL